MKVCRLSFTLLLLLVSFFANAQKTGKLPGQSQFVKARSVADLMTGQIIQDARFKELYTEYAVFQKRNFRCSFLMLNNLAMAAEIIDAKEAFDCINTFLSLKEEDRKIQGKYFQKMVEEVGITQALNFLQLETGTTKLFESRTPSMLGAAN